jgi:hypothetical protein
MKVFHVTELTVEASHLADGLAVMAEVPQPIHCAR